MHELMDPSSAQLHHHHHHHHHQQHQQEMSSHSLESMLQANCSGKPTNSSSQAAAAGDQRKPRPQPEQALKCPRCDSTNTKFCYYNNYSLSQPRYFCKSCRRYWTKGGTLRNVPVGGGCRKNKRSSSSSSNNSANSSATSTPTSSSSHFSNVSSLLTHLIPPSSYDSNDLALAFARLQKHHQLGFDHDQESPVTGQMFNTTNFLLHGNPAAAAGGTNTPAFLDALRNTNSSSSSSFLDVGNNLQGLYYGGGGEGGVYNGNSGFADHDGEQQDEQQNHEMAAVMTHQYNTGGDHESVSGPATTQAVTVTTMKQEQFLASSCMNGRQEESGNKVLWGFPWQMNGSCDNISSSNGTVVDNAMRASTESGSWWSSSSSNGGNNGGGVLGGSAATNWHGLLNTSPLM